MEQIERQADVIVVGGGLAGLASAAYLAREGRRVLLFEKADAPGGRARTRTLDGFHFNLGPHALYLGGKAAAVLRELGVAFEGGEPQVSGGYAVRSGVLHTLPIGFVSLLTTGLLRPKEKIEAARLLAGLRRLDTRAIQGVTLAAWVRDHVESPAVRDLMTAIVRVATYTHDPERLSAGAALAQVRRAGAGVLYLHGGWQSLVDRLRAAAAAAGVRIVTHRPVAAVVRDPAVRGVRLEDDTVVATSTVLIAGSPQMAAELTSTGTRTVVADWALRAVPVHAACLDVALERLPRPEAVFALGIDHPLYASVHSAVARLAPQGGALIQLARYGGLGGESAPAVEQQLRVLLDALQPGWRERVVRQRFLPDLIVSNAVVMAAEGGTASRPGPGVPEVPGLHVAGDWVGPDGMLADASLSSARRAAFAILATAANRTAAA